MLIRLIILYLLLIPNREIKVLSYNIRYNNPNDGKDIWDNRKESIVDFINHEDFDFAGLQEVTFSQLQYIEGKLVNYSYHGVGRDDGKQKGEFAPIFYNKNRYKLISGNTFWLSETPNTVSVGWDASMERICTYALFEDKKSKRKFYVFNTHFDHIGVIARKKSAQLIIDYVNSLNENNFPVFITGDFNLNDDSDPIILIQKTFYDSNINLNKEDKLYNTFTGFKNDVINPRRIDYIFYSNIEKVSSTHVHLKTKGKRWASDHHPVIAIFN